MTSAFSVHALGTTVLLPGDDLAGALLDAVARTEAGAFRDGDVVVVAETAVATVEGNIIQLGGVTPSPGAVDLGGRYGLDPRVAQVVLDESDRIVGGIDGFLLCLKNGTLLPNAGVGMGCAGSQAGSDGRGRTDLCGRTLQVTKRAVADNIGAAAELVMGEADESVPAALVRGLGLPIGDWTGIEGIAADECLFMGALRPGREV